MNNVETTEDFLLNKKIKILQPKDGYRVAIDPVFLASAVHPEPNDMVLDLGTGVGAASLCLGHRVSDCRIIGLEIQRSYARLAAQNIKLNCLNPRLEVLVGDFRNPPPRLAAGTFSHVMTNPPYFNPQSSQSSPNIGKATANQTIEGDLNQWIHFSLLMLKFGGTFTMIHMAERLDQILTLLYGKISNISIFPLWPKPGKAAKRILIQGQKQSKNSGIHLASGLILHNVDGSYTAQADAILRQGAALDLYH